mmetsp:Transcript_29163/g.61908  ORF Transcript_29163/g.61908 Transcript_29163/m.61908 type:complete len:1302 (+) Transcript_29163:372-4277(+)
MRLFPLVPRLLLFSDSCRSVIASARSFGDDGPRAAAGRRRLEEGIDTEVALDLARYSVKFDGCRADYRHVAVEAEMAEDEHEHGGRVRTNVGKFPWQRRRPEQDFAWSVPDNRGIVTFRLCANDNNIGSGGGSHNSSSTKCSEWCDDSEYGEIAVDMETYLQAVVDWKFEERQEYCENCHDCSFINGPGRRLEEAPNAEDVARCKQIDTAACLGECEKLEAMEEGGHLDAAEFVGCQRLYGNLPTGEEIYAGAACDNSGGASRIRIGVFLDEYCTVYDATKNVEDYLEPVSSDESGNSTEAKLSYDVLESTYEASDCVAKCLVEDGSQHFGYDVDGEQVEVPISPVCEELYYASFLYADYWDEPIQHFTPAPTALGSPYVTSMAFIDETCIREGAKGTYFAGLHCEHPATSICTRVAGANGWPHFCTNEGVCRGWTCECPEGFYGNYCEFEADGIDHEWEGEHINDNHNGNNNNHGEWEHEEHEDIYVSDDDANALDDAFFLFPEDESMNYTSREYNALVRLYSLTHGDSWENREGWLSNSSVCEWHGVTCDKGRSVSSLKLSQNSLVGAFNDIYAISLRRLANLTVLDLGHNNLFGVIPEEITDLRRLTHLKLENNQLSRSVPTSLSTLPKLRTLQLQENYLTYMLMNNGYDSLEHLDLGDNYLMGTLQYDLWRLSRLEYVSLRDNNLFGGLTNYPRLANLTHFDISLNQISGYLPEEGLSNNPKLRHLNVSWNNLLGPIRGNIMQAAFESGNEGSYQPYYVLDLSFNKLDGTMPNFDVSMLDINVVGNMLTGIDPMACEHGLWNGGAVGMFLCDGIACPNGTANSEGRRTSEANPCKQCNASSHFGTVGCQLDTYEEEEHGDDAGYVSADDDRFFGADDWADDELDCPLNCLNGGACVGASSPFQASYWCKCPPGYTGESCENIYKPTPPPTSYMPLRPSFPVDLVEYELWTTPTDIISRDFLLGFKESAQALSGYANFIPRLFISDGIQSGCVGANGVNLCPDSCTNGGRYCATQHHDEVGISGADIVAESMRWICIWDQLGYGSGGGVGVQWWEYISYFLSECVDPNTFDSEDCVSGAMNKAGIDPGEITLCIIDSGGLEGDVRNKFLEEQLYLKEDQGVTLVSTFRVNKNTIAGTLNPTTALEAICPGFKPGSAPSVCQLVDLTHPPAFSSQVTRPIPVPTSSSWPVILLPPTPALAPLASDEEKFADNATLPSTRPSIKPSFAIPSDLNASVNSTKAEPSSSGPSFAPSSQSDASTEPTSAVTDPDPDPNFEVNSGQNLFPLWQLLLLLIPSVLL